MAKTSLLSSLFEAHDNGYDNGSAPETNQTDTPTSEPLAQQRTSEPLAQQHTIEGVVTRICNFKYGFIRSDVYENLFFHFSEMSDDAKAFIEAGSKVTFAVKENGWTDDKKMKAVDIKVISAPGDKNAFKDLPGMVTCDMKARGFCFIENDGNTYLFHSTNLVEDETSRAAGDTVREGYNVIFDAEYNHKYNPPKPFAVNVRIVPGQDFGTVSALSPNEPDKLDNKVVDTTAAASRSSLGGGRGSISNRASALRSAGPARRWSRTTGAPTTSTFASTSSKPAGGLRLTVTTCKFGRKCTRRDCWFDHPKGREMEDGLVLADDSDSDSGSGGEQQTCGPCSMGKESLRLLIKGVVAEGKRGYLPVRNTLQKVEYLGRALTRAEKNSVADILEELDATTLPSATVTTSSSGTWRRSESTKWRSERRSESPPQRYSRATGITGTTGSRPGRVSLSDLCRDPSLHSRLSACSRGPACS